MIERGRALVLVEPGQSVLLSNTTITLSELPVMKVGSGVFYSFFFPDEVLAEVVPMSPRWNSHLFRIAEYPTLEGVTPLPEDAPAMHWIPPVNVKGLLLPMLTHVFNRPTFPFWKLCLTQIAVPRIRIQIFLENLVLSAPAEHGKIMEKYPGGKTTLLREMRRLKMPTVAAMLEQRHLELCLAWHHYGGRSFEDILPALKVTQPGRFRARYERWLVAQNVPVFPGVQSASYSDALLAAHPSFLPSINGQYWNLREAEENRERDRKRMETDESYRVLLEMADAALANNPDFAEQGPWGNPYAPSTLSGEVDGGFWEMKSTGAAMVIAAEGLTSFPGLEDCADLLAA